jgi:hypothetical protein
MSRSGRGQRGVRQVVERVERLLVPAQAESLDGASERDRGGEVELAVDVDRQPLAGADDLQHRLDTLQILGQRHAAHLHLHAGIAEAEIVLHLVL